MTDSTIAKIWRMYSVEGFRFETIAAFCDVSTRSVHWALDEYKRRVRERPWNVIEFRGSNIGERA